MWSNAGFSTIQDIPELGDYEPRLDPTVIPPASTAETIPSDLPAPKGQSAGANGYVSAAALHEAYKEGTVIPTDVARALLELISHSPQHSAAFSDVHEELVLAAAASSTERYREGKSLGLLDGVPVGIKDEIDIKDHKKRIGSKKDFTDPRNISSWCVEKWAEAGAVVVGKTNMHEMGMDTTNNNPWTVTPLNPHNSSYYTGGSSGGSAYAVAAGILPIAHGVDGGGSIRIPSSFCGLYGLKPSHRRISRYPTASLACSNSADGPMASNMADLEAAYRVMAEPNPSDTLNSLYPSPRVANPPPPSDRIICIHDDWFNAADPDVRDLCHKAVSHYSSIGYRIERVDIPYLQAGQLAHAQTILSEISTGLPMALRSAFSPAIRILLTVGSATPAMEFLLAQKLRNLLMQHLAHLWRSYPGMVLVTPTTPIAGWHISGGAAELKGGLSDGNTSVRNMTYVWLANFCGLPAISIPVGLADPKGGKGKVPVGLMAMGEWGDEERLIQWGKEGEAWAWTEGNMAKPAGWVDLLELAKHKK